VRSPASGTTISSTGGSWTRRSSRRSIRSQTAELVFENVWQAIEDITVQLLVPHLPPGVSLVEIPDEQRNAEFPKRFGSRVPTIELNREAPYPRSDRTRGLM
jgi:hypothetical protein